MLACAYSYHGRRRLDTFGRCWVQDHGHVTAYLFHLRHGQSYPGIFGTFCLIILRVQLRFRLLAWLSHLP